MTGAVRADGPARRRASGPLPLAGLVAVVAFASASLGLAGCGPSAASPSFDAAAPCTRDQRLAGAYPTLEARLPRALFGVAATQVDSGRNCTTANLGTLAGHGISEVRFAGARWDRSATSGVTLALFEGDGLTAERLGEWYESSARAAAKTAGIKPSRTTIDGRPAYRLDLLASEVEQSVIVWPSADGSAVQVVIGAAVPEGDIQAGIAAFG